MIDELLAETAKYERRVKLGLYYTKLISQHVPLKLVDIGTCTEKGFPEPTFLFDDELGTYTLEGLIGTYGHLFQGKN